MQRAVKMYELCLLVGKVSSEDSLGSTSCGENAAEMMRIQRILGKTSEEPYHGTCRIFEIFSVKRKIYSQIQKLCWYLAIVTRRRETISVLDSTKEAKQGKFFRIWRRQIKELYYKVWSNLRESNKGAAVLFEQDEKKCQEEWRQTIRSLWKRSRKLEFFSVCVP
nr:AEL_HP1_G0031040.mRNA.1.CDS.1 [Saccharomyces cerevisiae]